MESLLSLAFSNISSRQTLRIRKGLRQIEGLLAQICLSTTSAHQANRQLSVVCGAPVVAKQLLDLGEDPAFLEFYRLQDGFEWNVTTHLITCLERLLSMPPNASNDNLLTSAIYLLQGMLILHPPSTALFNQELHMVLLLDLLSPSLPADLQNLALSTILLTLLNNPRNARIFEKVNGLVAIASLLKSPHTADDVRIGALELLYTYLLPDEHPDHAHVDHGVSIDSDASLDGYATDTMRRAPRSAELNSNDLCAAVGRVVPVDDSDAALLLRRTDEEKEQMVSVHLGDIGYLYEAFELNRVFEMAV